MLTLGKLQRPDIHYSTSLPAAAASVVARRDGQASDSLAHEARADDSDGLRQVSASFLSQRAAGACALILRSVSPRLLGT